MVVNIFATPPTNESELQLELVSDPLSSVPKARVRLTGPGYINPSPATKLKLKF